MIPMFCKTLGYKTLGSAKSDLGVVRYISLTKSTPSVIEKGKKVSGDPWGIFSGAVALLNSNVIASFRYLADIIDPVPVDRSQERPAEACDRTIGQLLDEVVESRPSMTQRPIGKLGFKLEAAGKVRVFAMVECWTQ